VFEVLDAIEAVADRRVPHRVVARRAGDPVATYSDTSKSEQLLRWSAEYGLPEIVETAFRWHERQLEREQATPT
jgi:UDP-glucose 4-epimerase